MTAASASDLNRELRCRSVRAFADAELEIVHRLHVLYLAQVEQFRQQLGSLAPAESEAQVSDPPIH